MQIIPSEYTEAITTRSPWRGGSHEAPSPTFFDLAIATLPLEAMLSTFCETWNPEKWPLCPLPQNSEKAPSPPKTTRTYSTYSPHTAVL